MHKFGDLLLMQKREVHIGNFQFKTDIRIHMLIKMNLKKIFIAIACESIGNHKMSDKLWNWIFLQTMHNDKLQLLLTLKKKMLYSTYS